MKASIRHLRKPKAVSSAARFPGDPGRGYLYVGATDPGTAKGVPLNTFEAELWPDGKTKHKLVREYGQTVLISSGDKTKLTGYAKVGRITLYSSLCEPYSYADVVNGQADADLTANANFYKGLNGVVWFCLAHEPETKTPTEPRSTSTSASRNDFRQAYRYIKKFYDDAGVTNVAYIGSYIISDTYKNADTKNFWFEWDPDYMVGDPTYVAGQPKFADIVDCDGWDPYNPRVEDLNIWANTPSARTRSWPDQWNEYDSKVRLQVQYGKRRKPMVIGELGIYADDWVPNATVNRQLQQDGMTPKIFYEQMATIGPANDQIVGVAHWNNSNCAPNDEKDPSGDRRNGWKDMCALPRVKMIEIP